MIDAKVMDLDQELFWELTEPLVQPLLVHMASPFVNGFADGFLKIKMKEPERGPRRRSNVFIWIENQTIAFKEGRIPFQCSRNSTEHAIIL